MKIILYICGAISSIVAVYEFIFWMGKSSLANVIILLAVILAINSFVLARREK
jgi:drug/metabolite transporter superfamily protein YnfA